MSERGSFVTEYISCAPCLAVVRFVLRGMEEPTPGDTIRAYQIAVDIPVVAGRIKQSTPGGELLYFEELMGDALARRLCHPLRVAVLAEDGASAVFLVRPGADTETIAEGSGA